MDKGAEQMKPTTIKKLRKALPGWDIVYDPSGKDGSMGHWIWMRLRINADSCCMLDCSTKKQVCASAYAAAKTFEGDNYG